MGNDYNLGMNNFKEKKIRNTSTSFHLNLLETEKEKSYGFFAFIGRYTSYYEVNIFFLLRDYT